MTQLVARETSPVRGEVRGFVLSRDVSDREAAALLAGGGPREVIVRPFRDRNLITNTGRQRVASLIVASTTASFVVPAYIGFGTTAIAPTASSTTLTGETYRKACSTVAVLATYYGRWVANLTTTEVSGTFLGMALFASSSQGDMWAIVSTSVAKSTTQALVAEWRWLVSSA